MADEKLPDYIGDALREARRAHCGCLNDEISDIESAIHRYAREREAAALEREDAASRSAMPPEVLARLGDDATPERAVASFTAHRDESHPCADMDADEALGMYQHALAAAAIRECEARRKREAAQIACEVAMFSADPEGMNRLAAARDAAANEEREATEQYDALRHWRQP